MMKIKTIQLSDVPAALLRRLRRSPKGRFQFIVTWRGEPVACITDIDQETLSLSTNPKFIAILERSRRSMEREGGIPLEEVRRRFGLKPRRSTKSTRGEARKPVRRSPRR